MKTQQQTPPPTPPVVIGLAQDDDMRNLANKIAALSLKDAVQLANYMKKKETTA